jgi:hypothetical protein
VDMAVSFLPLGGVRGGALGYVHPELGFGEGLCMLMSVVMATVRSV